MGLLLLAASQGTSITISTTGPDEADAMAALCDLVRRGFDEAPAGHGAPFGSGKDTPWS